MTGSLDAEDYLHEGQWGAQAELGLEAWRGESTWFKGSCWDRGCWSKLAPRVTRQCYMVGGRNEHSGSFASRASVALDAKETTTEGMGVGHPRRSRGRGVYIELKIPMVDHERAPRLF